MATGAKRDASDGWCRVGNRECRHISMDAVIVSVVPLMEGTTQPKMDGEQPVEEMRRHVGPECEYCNDACRRLSVLEDEKLGCPLVAPFDYLTPQQRKDIEEREKQARDLYQAHKGRRRRKPGPKRKRGARGKAKAVKAKEPAVAKPEEKTKEQKPTVKKTGPQPQARKGKVGESTQTTLVTELAEKVKKPGPRAGKQTAKKEPEKLVEKRKPGRPPGIHTKIKTKRGGRRKSTRKAPAKSKEKTPSKARVKKPAVKEPEKLAEKRKSGRPPGIHTKIKKKRGGRRKIGGKSSKSTQKAKAQTKGKETTPVHMQKGGRNHGAKKN